MPSKMQERADQSRGPNPFSSGDEGGGKLNEFMDKLLIVTPTEFQAQVSTSVGESDMILADLVVIDEKDPTKSQVVREVPVWGKVLVPALKRILDNPGRPPAFGRLGKGKKREGGKSPAIILASPSDDEIALAIKYNESQADPNPFSDASTDEN
jgi:hypothetical protein